MEVLFKISLKIILKISKVVKTILFHSKVKFLRIIIILLFVDLIVMPFLKNSRLFRFYNYLSELFYFILFSF